MKNKLIPCTEKVLETYLRLCNGEITEEEALMIPVRYAKFLSQPLKLEMFVPCVDGKPLSIPYTEKYMSNHSIYHSELRAYRDAKSKVLFDGFLESDFFCYNDFRELKYLVRNYETIEKLVSYEFNLTPTALKQIYG